MPYNESEGQDSYAPIDFSKIKVGIKPLSDAVYNLSDIRNTNPNLGDKKEVLRAISDKNVLKMRDISNYFYRVSGIYNRLCRYLAYMYRYDWKVTTYIEDSAKEKLKNEKVIGEFNKTLRYLDNTQVKQFLGDAALKVIKNGCYYGYLIDRGDRMAVQELPMKYCRSRFFSADGRPVVEFNMRYFDDFFRDNTQKQKMLEVFPEEFKKGYNLYRKGKLIPDFPGDTSGWYLLDTKAAFKFNINGEDFPFLISVIPALIDLDDMQGLDRKKMEQELLKIIIQKMPIDKNGDLIFDVDEAQALHNNAVRMLGRAIGIDVLTTFADTEVADMSSTSATTAADDSMNRVKAAVYDQAGISQMQFNTDGNIALEKSVLNDEATLYNLIQQFEQLLNVMITQFNKSPKQYSFKVQILGTTIYNYKELTKLYKEQTTLGGSKVLPLLALGQSQSSILADAYFENEVLNLVEMMVPPMSSNTMNADYLANRNAGGSKNATQTADKNKDANKDANSADSESKGGRPEKENDQKSEKTIKNIEAQG